jgi:ABC-2 type transport system permease protein
MISIGLQTLLQKEVRRFLRVPGQTLLSPLVTTTLYFVVFGYSLGGQLRQVDGVPYARVIVPGLVALGLLTNAYGNSSSSLFAMKLQGTIIDLLVSPLSYGELLAGFVLAAALRGLIVGGVVWLVAGAFTGLSLAHPLLVLLSLSLVATLFAALGVITAIWASTFEQLSFFPTFFIMPLTFLGGVFTSAAMLPPGLRRATFANPIFYLVDAVRFAMLGRSDVPLALSMGLLCAFCLVALGVAYAMLASGYKLRG